MYFIELKYTWMANYPQDVHFPRHSLHVSHLPDLRLHYYLHRHRLPRQQVHPLLHQPECPRPHRPSQQVVSDLLPLLLRLTVHYSYNIS
jgi:hypothetical protein